MPKVVLTVDDSKVVRTIVARHLRPFGIDVLEAENGQVGLAKARESKPQLILLDYNMPVLDGEKTLESLKADAELHDIPVIMLTTEAVAETVVKLIKMGLKNYVTKPFSREDLLLKANQVLHLFEGNEVPSEDALMAANLAKSAGM